MMAGIALGSVLAPLAVAAFGARGAFLVAGVFLPLLGLVAWVRIRRLDDRATVPGPAFAALSALPFLAALPQRALEQLSWGAMILDHPTDAVIIQEGASGTSSSWCSRVRCPSARADARSAGSERGTASARSPSCARRPGRPRWSRGRRYGWPPSSATTSSSPSLVSRVVRARADTLVDEYLAGDGTGPAGSEAGSDD